MHSPAIANILLPMTKIACSAFKQTTQESADHLGRRMIWAKGYKWNIVIMHCREEGCIGAEGCKIPAKRQILRSEGGIFSNSSRLEAVYRHFFSREGGIGNYIPNGWVVLTVLSPIHPPPSGKKMAKIRKWLVCTSVGQDVHLAQNQKAISVLLLLLLWWVPDVDKWYRTLGSGEGCLPTSSSVCTLSHSGAHCSVQCSSGWELVAPPPPPHLPACHTDNTCTVTPALHSSNCIASNHHSHRQEQEMQRETTSAARTLHCSWNALSSPASHRRLFALSLPIVFFAVHFAAGATFFAALPLLIDAF